MATRMDKENPEQLQSQIDQDQGPGTFSPLQSSSDSPDDTEATVEKQLEFAESAFANIQELNRTMDQKANNLLAATALLTAALGLVLARAIEATVQEDWQRVLKDVSMLLLLPYLLLVFTLIFAATSIYQARRPRTSANTTAPGMIFPLMLLERFTVSGKVDEMAYLSRLRTLRPDDLLQDYANQIIEVSIIYKEKQRQVNLGLWLFRWTGILWIVTMLAMVTVIIVLQ
jgi:hypothetical protein